MLTLCEIWHCSLLFNHESSGVGGRERKYKQKSEPDFYHRTDLIQVACANHNPSFQVCPFHVDEWQLNAWCIKSRNLLRLSVCLAASHGADDTYFDCGTCQMFSQGQSLLWAKWCFSAAPLCCRCVALMGSILCLHLSFNHVSRFGWLFFLLFVKGCFLFLPIFSHVHWSWWESLFLLLWSTYPF